MTITINSFVLEFSFTSFYIRIPLVGEAFICKGSTVFNRLPRNKQSETKHNEK